MTNRYLDIKLNVILQNVQAKVETEIKVDTYEFKTDVTTLVNCVKLARSMDQILQCGFTYDKENSGKVICSVCHYV